MKYQSPLESMYQWESEIPDQVYLREPIQGKYHEITWAETARQTRKMAAYLKSLDLPSNSKISILSKNCSHWFISDLAIMMSGHITIPLYPNLTSDNLKLILEHSETVVAFVGKLDNYDELKSGIPEGITCISYPYYPREQHLQWDKVTEDIDPIEENVIRDPDDTATIMYTSGTTGIPKGVMHRFYNYSYAIYHAMKEENFQQGERFISYLPLCHIAERMLVQIGSLHVGGTVSFAESIDTFAKNLQESTMTVFLAVPRIWEKFQQGILTKLPQKKLNLLLSIPIISGIIKGKIKKTLGLTGAKHIYTGAAAAAPSLLEFFAKLGIHIQEAYAMTENTCYSHVNRRNDIQIGSVGQAFPNCDVRISEDGEIQVKHEALMTGYYKEPKLTKETFTADGYLRTGDEGIVDENGFLRITGRLKDLFKTSKGKYIAPVPIEMMIMESEDIDQVCIVGVGLPQPMVLCILSELGLKKSAEEMDTDLGSLVSSINSQLDLHEEIAKMVVLKEEWTPENEILTPTLKVKRKEIDKRYSENYEKWYGEEGTVVWTE
ncbi:AMP-binding protein [Bacteroidota bacterium]